MAEDNNQPNPFETPPENGSPSPEAPVIEEEALPEGTPGVAAKAGKTYIALGIVAVVVVALVYSIFSGGDKKINPEDEKPNKIDINPKSENPPPLPEPPKVEPPKLPDPATNELAPPLPVIPPPAIPDPVPVPVVDDVINPKDDSAEKAQLAARLKSNMLIKDGGTGALGGLGGGGAQTTPPAAAVPSTDPNSQFAIAVGSSKVERVDATKITTLRRTIAQGRVIQATLETAINTDLSAPIRAIVSVDTYGEDGTVPLIPKGSRLVGSYNTTLTSGQSRVFVVWTRMIRPDGVDVKLDSPLIDAIGQAGVSGQLDSKFQEIFARSLVSSVMNIAMAIGSDEISGGGQTTTTTSTTGSQTSGDAVTTATTNALNRLGATTDGFIQRFLNVPPTILVDQGTKVNVMVNKDLYFSEETAGVRIIN